MQTNHIIWSDINLNLDDWKADLQAQHPEADENELYRIMCETNNDYLADERINLNIQLPTEIIVIGELGLWNGKAHGYKIIDSGNIKDCLYSECDMNEWYVDKNGDFRCTAIHHDGRNYYLYRAFKPTATESQIESLKDKIYMGTATRKDITRVTRRLGDDIGAVYGWKMPHRSQMEVER